MEPEESALNKAFNYYTFFPQVPTMTFCDCENQAGAISDTGGGGGGGRRWYGWHGPCNGSKTRRILLLPRSVDTKTGKLNVTKKKTCHVCTTPCNRKRSSVLGADEWLFGLCSNAPLLTFFLQECKVCHINLGHGDVPGESCDDVMGLKLHM